MKVAKSVVLEEEMWTDLDIEAENEKSSVSHILRKIVSKHQETRRGQQDTPVLDKINSGATSPQKRATAKRATA